MLTRTQLDDYLKELLLPENFQDYCPNGLQIQGKQEIQKIITGVSANQAFIAQAIACDADAILVHHGFFWKNEPPQITGYKHNRIKSILLSDMSLFAYHLPLDAHPTLGNNIQLAQILDIKHPTPTDDPIIWRGEVNMTATEFSELIAQNLQRTPQLYGNKDYIKSIAFCTGGAQNYLTKVLDLRVDAYLSGEVSEQTPAIATENNMLYIAAGHHATECYGVQAVGEHIANKFNIDHQFINIHNPV